MPTEFTLEQLQVVRLISITHFLEFGGVGGLYVRAKNILHTLRPKTSRLWDIWSRFDLIFASGVLRVITQRCVRAGSSHSIWSPQTVFTDFWVSVTLANCRIQSLRREKSPRTPESVENWPLWVQERFWSKSQKFQCKIPKTKCPYSVCTWLVWTNSWIFDIIRRSQTVQNVSGRLQDVSDENLGVFWRKTEENSKSDDSCITMYRLVYRMVHLFFGKLLRTPC